MPEPLDRTRQAFRLDLEQQKKRAKDLCHSARNGDLAAIARIRECRAKNGRAPAPEALKLADTQSVIARELGLASWSSLKDHIAAMERELAAIGNQDPPALAPPERWVGGVRIRPQARTWRWNDDEDRPVLV